MNTTAKPYVDLTEQEKQELRDLGLTEEDIGICIMLRNGCPGGDIIQLDLPRLAGEDEETYSARYVAALERGDYLRPPVAPSAASTNGRHSEAAANAGTRTAAVPTMNKED